MNAEATRVMLSIEPHTAPASIMHKKQTFRKLWRKAKEFLRRPQNSNVRDNNYNNDSRGEWASKRLETEYIVGTLSLTLPEEHLLPQYQKEHPQYDRFLPHLAKHLGQSMYVIDVGANCADTVAGMATNNPFLKYLCIEPDEEFYSYLRINVAKINEAYPGTTIVTAKLLVSESQSNVCLEGAGGTKHAVQTEHIEKIVSSSPLDNILSTMKIPAEEIALLKVDVDGYDYDVINSGSRSIGASLPLIFFECDCSNEQQRHGYKMVLQKLSEMGYKSWAVFDNFGAALLRTNDINQVSQILDYVWKQDSHLSTRTIYYIDILASTDRHSDLVEAALSSY